LNGVSRTEKNLKFKSYNIFFATDDRSEEELQRSVELSGECSQKTYTHARVEREIKYIAVLKYLGIKDLSEKEEMEKRLQARCVFWKSFGPSLSSARS